MSPKIKFSAVIGAVLIMGAAIFYWYGTREITVRIVNPQTDTDVRVFGIGTVEAQVVSKVGFQLTGKLSLVGADQGEFVKKGALLAKLDDDAQRGKLMKSEAAQRQAAANLLRAQAQRDRADVLYQQKKSVNSRRQSLVGRGTVSQEAAEDTQAAEEIASSELKLVEADVTVANVLQDDAAAQRRIDAVLLDQHELRAPFDARVVARHKELGGVVNAGESVFTLIEPASIWIRAYVDEASAGGLQIGQKAVVRLRSEANTEVEAEIVRIDQENDRVTEERRVYVRCLQCGPQHQFRFLGEQAEVEIVKKRIAAGQFIPLKFVEGYDGRSGTIWILENGRLAKRQVQFGERLLDGRVQIVGGTTPDTAIVADDKPGMRVGRAARPQSDSGS